MRQRSCLPLLCAVMTMAAVAAGRADASAAETTQGAPRLDLVAPAGSTKIVESTVTLDSPAPGPTEWFAKPDSTWLTVTPITGITPTRVTVRANPSGLAPGIQRAVLRFVDDAGEAMLIVPVTFTIGDAAGTVTPGTPAAQPARPAGAAAGASAPAAQAESIRETLVIPIDALPSASRNLPYSQVIPVRGGKPPYTLRIVEGRLPPGLTMANGAISGVTRFPGTYLLTVAASDASSPPLVIRKALALRVIVAYQNAALSVTPAGISLTASAGQPRQTARIAVESGPAPLAWTAAGDVAWVRISPSQGMAPAVLVVEVDAAGLDAGTHVATITVAMEGVPNSPMRIPVQVLVRR